MPKSQSSGSAPPPAALVAGERLGPYVVEAPLGAGGMGEVWRGRDTRIDRSVAIKVLPRGQAVTPEAEERFEREARAIGQLQHPNVCTLFDVGSHDGRRYIVFEHLDGESLSARLARGRLPLTQVLSIGSAIAEALAAAHAAGILHRDLKPANVMLTRAGTKLLDFGLARFTGAEPPGLSSSGSSAMTWAAEITAQGTLVGTLSYMAPEQLEGRNVDERADLWALGCVLHEMVSGKKAFEGESAAGVIASVLQREPEPLTALAPGTPTALERLVLACLQKNRDERWRSAADLRRELGWIETSGPASGLPAPRRRARAAAVTAIAAAAALAGALGAGLFTKSRGSGGPSRAVQSVLPFRARLSDPFGKVPQISPDGRQVVVGSTTSYSAEPLWLLALDSQEPRPLAGTEGGTFPFWSPDGRSLGFFVDRRLLRIDLEGGSVRTLSTMEDDPRGGAWSSKGVILFSPGRKGGLQRVSSEGGPPVSATKLDGSRGEVTHRWPQFLPGGERFLYWASGNDDKLYLKDSVRLSSLSGGEGNVVLEGVSNAVWTAGHLVHRAYGDRGARGLLAQRFDLDRGAVSGSAFPLTPALIGGAGVSLLRVSGTAGGDLVFLGEPPTWSTEMVWLDRAGAHVATLAEPAPWEGPRISPDGRRVALARTDLQASKSSVWVTGADGSNRVRLTLDGGSAGVPAWSPDGRKIAYLAGTTAWTGIYVRPASGGPAELLVSMNGIDTETLDWSPDGSRIAFGVFDAAAGNYDIWTVALASKKAAPFLATPADEADAQFSPDGRFLAYTSRQAGAKGEVYLWRLGGETRWQVSEGGGGVPRWRKDGKELFFAGRDGRLRSVAVGNDPGGTPGTPRVVFERRLTLTQYFSYDVSPDGSKFLVDMPSPESLDVSVRLLQNWPALVPKAR
ncbi:MAG: serine/threonine-protein kinase [Thermoanaerobaculia bacterium]|nr:serine/threonine-protein kinase [Thermoanaerobaculia bacterium]